jgi:hypothetical protein
MDMAFIQPQSVQRRFIIYTILTTSRLVSTTNLLLTASKELSRGPLKFILMLLFPGGHKSATVLRAIPLRALSSSVAIRIAAEREGLLGFAAKALREVAKTLPETERLYLQIALGGPGPLPAREVARLMQRPVEEIHRLRPRVLKLLKDALESRGEVKTWRASV